MSGLIGPAGVLPPGEWGEGARVRFGLFADTLRSGWITEVPKESTACVWVASFGGPGVGGAPHDPLSKKDWHISLDLSTGCLGHGCRALLSLVEPQIAQPACPPLWSLQPPRNEPNPGADYLWTLTLHGEDHIQDERWPKESDVECPRRALVLALEALS